MNASNFMDKQIMDLSRSKNTDLNNNDTNSHDFVDLMNPQSEEEGTNDIRPSSLNNTNDEILPNYDFQPIHRPAVADPPPVTASSIKSWNSLDSKSNSTPLRSYNSVDHVEPDRMIFEKSQKVTDSAIVSEIDRTMKRYIDSVLNAIDGLSARLSQLESRTRHLEHSVDELKISVGNSHGSTDGKMRQLENILLEVQNGVHDLKDKQEVMEGHMQLAKMQISKAEQSPELPKAFHPDPVQQIAASAPPQQSGLPQFSAAAPQQAPLPSNVPPPSQQHSHPPPGTTQFPSGHIPPGHIPPGPQQDSYFSPPSQTQEAPSQQYQMPPPAQHQQQSLALAPPPQQYQSTLTPPYPQPPQQQHSTGVGASTPHISPPLGHLLEDSPFVPSQTYPPNLHQSASQPSSTPPHSQPYYGSPTSMYEPPPTGRSNSGISSAYVPPSGPGEQYPYGGPASHYSSGSSIKAQPHSPVGSGSNYPQLPTAKILPQPIPTAAGLGGGSNSGGSGNRVPIDDVVDKVTSMGFPKDLVRATVRKLTENGQSVDLNVVLDKLMNDGEIQQRAWFGR
ncbi:actin cytoskeleton-regulatory complex protein PAN1-like [Chenopodium quinoa]|uniref:DUF1421 domain-containing protein n=1 Tax=Chenopodium quinoa TaxID=63459 RepID=A0A803NB13_CHEQI|nr:actin cytoskeleton-regulatory complex protein PAN1-like [Chenopodium quinoa]XP_021727679.1 actin cytoskeleton-regulatory complex protein PAN1-like [Chenopodium quinoa]